MANKAGEIVVLEMLGKKVSGEPVRIPDNKADAAGAPRNYGVGFRVIHHFIGFLQKRWWTNLV